MNKFLKFVLLGTFMFSFAANGWDKKEEVSDPDTTKTVRYEQELDLDMLKSMRTDLEDALKKDSKIKTYHMDITSPGGSVLLAIEMARLLNRASQNGLVVEIHAIALCASGCTVLLASGSRGHRIINDMTLFLVHPIQSGGFGGFVCVDHKADAKDQNDKATNVLMEMLRDEYMKFTGKDQQTVEDWLTCGKERVGRGQLAIDMGIADKVE